MRPARDRPAGTLARRPCRQSRRSIDERHGRSNLRRDPGRPTARHRAELVGLAGCDQTGHPSVDWRPRSSRPPGLPSGRGHAPRPPRRCGPRYGERPALALRADDDTLHEWSYSELRRRSRIAAWRLRALGLEAGDRILTWSPATPELPAAYFGAMRAGVIYVPLDLRMAPDAIERVAARRRPDVSS